MYIRMIARKDGALFLEQYLTFKEPGKNGRPAQDVSRWEVVPTVGRTDAQAMALPIGMTCGIFLIEATENIFSSVSEGHKDVSALYSVSALDVYKITQIDGGVQVFTKDRVSFNVKLPYLEFIGLLTSLLNKFQIVKIDEQGRITKE